MKQKYLAGGIDGWMEHEILELALSYALPRRDTKKLSKELIARFRNFGGVLDADPRELATVKGISEHSVVFIKLLKDISGYYLKKNAFRKDLLSSPASVVNYFRAVLKGAADEEFHAVFLNAGNFLVAAESLQKGTVNRSAVYPRKIAERALYHHAVGVIIVHNHPGGSLKPSEDDVKTTCIIKNALATVDVGLLDHIIIAGDGYFSWKEQGML